MAVTLPALTLSATEESNTHLVLDPPLLGPAHLMALPDEGQVVRGLQAQQLGKDQLIAVRLVEELAFPLHTLRQDEFCAFLGRVFFRLHAEVCSCQADL